MGAGGARVMLMFSCASDCVLISAAARQIDIRVASVWLMYFTGFLFGLWRDGYSLPEKRLCAGVRNAKKGVNVCNPVDPNNLASERFQLAYVVADLTSCLRGVFGKKKPSGKAGFKKDRRRHTLPQKLQYHLRGRA